MNISQLQIIIMMLVRRCAYLFKKIKNIQPQSWVIRPEDATVPFYNQDQSHLEIKVEREIKKEYSRKSQSEALQPVSPIPGPIKVQNPVVFDKVYRWCSCGLSFKQPFCDGSHQGTDFKPFKFTIEEKVKDIQLCGCKLTNSKPFCDNVSCKKLHSSESTQIQQIQPEK